MTGFSGQSFLSEIEDYSKAEGNMDTADYMNMSGKSFQPYGHLARYDSPVTPSERGRAMVARRMMVDKTGHKRVHHKTCEACGAAYQPTSRECPYCGVREE